MSLKVLLQIRHTSRLAQCYTIFMNKTKPLGGTAHTLPNDLKQSLLTHDAAMTLWQKLTPLGRNVKANVDRVAGSAVFTETTSRLASHKKAS